MALAVSLFIEQGNGKDLGDAPVGIAVLIVLDRLAWPAGLQHQRRLMFQYLDDPAANTPVPDLEADELAQLLHGICGHSGVPALSVSL